MRSAPPHRPPAPPADPGMRAIGGAVCAIVVLAGLGGVVEARMLSARQRATAGSEAAGLILAPARTGVLVDSIGAGGAAMRAGLHVGDRIEAVNGIGVSTVDDTERAMGRPTVDIRARRGDKAFDVHLECGGATAWPTRSC